MTLLHDVDVASSSTTTWIPSVAMRKRSSSTWIRGSGGWREPADHQWVPRHGSDRRARTGPDRRLAGHIEAQPSLAATGILRGRREQPFGPRMTPRDGDELNRALGDREHPSSLDEVPLERTELQAPAHAVRRRTRRRGRARSVSTREASSIVNPPRRSRIHARASRCRTTS